MKRAAPDHDGERRPAARVGPGARPPGARGLVRNAAPAELEWLDGGITAVPGVFAAGLHCGIKPGSARDLALVYSSAPATVAGVFTTNRIQGAPVKVTRERVKAGVAQAIVASSGCSNVATGEQGLKDAREMTEVVAQAACGSPRPGSWWPPPGSSAATCRWRRSARRSRSW